MPKTLEAACELTLTRSDLRGRHIVELNRLFNTVKTAEAKNALRREVTRRLESMGYKTPYTGTLPELQSQRHAAWTTVTA